MRACLAFFLLPGCAAFEPQVITAGHTVCVVGTCEHLLPILKELKEPELEARIKAAQSGAPRQ